MDAQFFMKYAGEHTEYDALKLMYNKMCAAKHKCKENDPSYMKELAILTEMLEDFWQIKKIDYRTLK